MFGKKSLAWWKGVGGGKTLVGLIVIDQEYQHSAVLRNQYLA